MMQVSFAGMRMQSLFMMMQSDFLGRYGCKSTFLNAKCPLWVCHDVNAHLWVCYDANAFHLTQMQINQRFFSFFYIFQINASSTLEIEIFQNSIYLFFSKDQSSLIQ